MDIKDNKDNKNNKDMLQLSFMTEVASMYYEKNMTQAEIAKKLYISRTKVARLLKKARDKGIVEIKINHMLNRNFYLEDWLKEQFNLQKVILYDSRGKATKENQDGVIKLAAEYIEQSINKEMIIGISWGHTVMKTVDLLSNTHKIPINIVEIMGSASSANILCNGNNIANKLASKYNGYAHNLNAPLFVDVDMKERLEKNPIVAKSLSMVAKADLVITSVGTLNQDSTASPWTGYITKQMLKELEDQDAVGCIGARFFDREGKILDNEWNKHCIGMNLADLKKIKEVILVAEGQDKVDALLGALKGGFVDVLISDSVTIQEMFSL